MTTAASSRCFHRGAFRGSTRSAPTGPRCCQQYFHAEVLRSAADGDTVFIEVHWTGTKADGTPLDERGVLIAGVRDDRIAWGRLYTDEVEPEGADIDATVRRMAGTQDP
jgi:hypothetical protein